MLMSGLKDSGLIMSSRKLTVIAVTSSLMAKDGVRYAVLIDQPRKPLTLIAYTVRR